MAYGSHMSGLAEHGCCALLHLRALTVLVFSLRAIAEAVGKNVGVPAEGLLLEDAYAKKIWPPWVTSLYVLNQRADSSKAERMLGWGGFKNIKMLSDIESGSYTEHTT